jgi:hypothetical protein
MDGRGLIIFGKLLYVQMLLPGYDDARSWILAEGSKGREEACSTAVVKTLFFEAVRKALKSSPCDID